MGTKNISRAFRLPPELDRQLEENAKRHGYVSRSEYLRHIVRRALNEEKEGMVAG